MHDFRLDALAVAEAIECDRQARFGYTGFGVVLFQRLPRRRSTPRSIPTRARTLDGLRKFFKQFSFPGGIGSHCTPETPGSIHEGGELGYSVSHAYGAAFDAPDRLVVVMVGDGEAETGPLATAWHSNKFLNPIRDGAVLPVLHLNGYKINNPSILARISHKELEALFEGYGYTPYFVEGSEPESMHQAMAATLEHCVGGDPRDPGGRPRRRVSPGGRPGR